MLTETFRINGLIRTLLMPAHKGEDDVLLHEISEGLHEQFEITPPTIQIVHNENNKGYQKDCVSSK